MTPDNDVDPLTATPIFEPESVPHDPAFAAVEARGAAVSPSELRVPAIRQRFASPPAWQPEMRADMRLFNPDRPPRAASVLIPIVVHAETVCVLLTERTAHLHDLPVSSLPGVESRRVHRRHRDALRKHTRRLLTPAIVDVIGNFA